MLCVVPIERNKIPAHSMIYLNSTGGNLLAGLKLGRFIRKSRFFTQVNAHGDVDPKPGANRHKADSGVCLAAATDVTRASRLRRGVGNI